MIEIIHDCQLRDKNTFAIDGISRRWIEYDNAADLPMIFQDYGDAGSIKAIGQGSNMLFAPHYDGTLIHSNITGISAHCVGDKIIASIGAGLMVDDVCAWAARSGYWGLENLSGIPGQMGAAAVQNIGAYGVEIKDLITCVDAYDTRENKFVKLSNSACGYAYRSSRFKTGRDKDRYVVTYVTIELSLSPKPRLQYGHLHSRIVGDATPQNIRQAVIDLRNEKLPDPKIYGNAGSFFMNPVISCEKYASLCQMFPNEQVPHYEAGDDIKVPAAWLIDRAGLKGYRVGGAQVWHKQPLVIVNADGKATAKDVKELRDAIISQIYQLYGIRLTPEVEETN